MVDTPDQKNGRAKVKGIYIDGIFEPEWALREVQQHHMRDLKKREKEVLKEYGKLPF